MAILNDATRAQIWRGLMRYWSNLREPIGGVTKTDLRDAVNACDQWIEDNQGSYNTALPLAFRTNATAAQKTLLFCAVALARVSVPVLKQIFGEVD